MQGGVEWPATGLGKYNHERDAPSVMSAGWQEDCGFNCMSQYALPKDKKIG